MTKQVNPWVKGTLPRGRHLAYQGVLFVLSVILLAIKPESSENIWVLLAFGSVSWFFEVKRLHDAGHNGAWSLPVTALFITYVVIVNDKYPSEDEAIAGGWALIGNIVGFIVICALPTKKDNNPYKPVKINSKTPRNNATSPPPVAKNIKDKPADNITPSHQTAATGQTKMVDAFHFFGVPTKINDINVATYLHRAILDSNIAYALELINSGAYINMKDNSDLTPLHYAAAFGHDEIVVELCANGANIQAKGSNNRTPLHLAASNGHADIAFFLVNSGGNIDAIDGDGATPLHLAVWFGQVETVIPLVDAGADINAKTNYGFTPLHLAAAKGYNEIALALVKAGANLSAHTDKENTPLDIAIEKHGKDSTIALFLMGAMEKKGGESRQKADELLRELD